MPEGRRPIHPVIAGIGFGLMVPLYPNFLMFGLLGIGLVMLVGWRTSPEPRAYLVRAAVTVGIAAVLASWYLGPLLVAYSQGRTEVVADLFKSGALANTQFALLGSRSWVLFALQLTGAAGVLVLWRLAWWARPMGLLAAGVLVVKAVMLLRFVDGGHSFMLLYVPYLMRFMAAAAGVLTLWEAARLLGPVLRTRLATPPRLVGVAAVAALVGVIGASAYAGSWLVMPAGYLDANGAKASGVTSLSTAAHAEYRPDGTKPRYPYGTMAPLFPAAQVYRDIDDELGKGADPVVLSADQRVFSFRDLRNYLPPARESSNALTLWDTRERGLREIAAIDDPAVSPRRWPTPTSVRSTCWSCRRRGASCSGATSSSRPGRSPSRSSRRTAGCRAASRSSSARADAGSAGAPAHRRPSRVRRSPPSQRSASQRSGCAQRGCAQRRAIRARLRMNETRMSWAPVTARTSPDSGVRMSAWLSWPKPASPQCLTAPAKNAHPRSESRAPATSPFSIAKRSSMRSSRTLGGIRRSPAAKARATRARPRPWTPTTTAVAATTMVWTSKVSLPIRTGWT